MLDEFVELLKGAFVQQKLDALPRGELGGVVLPLAAFRTSSFFGPAVKLLQFFQLFSYVHN